MRIKSLIKRLMHPEPSRNYNEKTTYSQCGEDVILMHLLESVNISKPNYIDIGAHHPYYMSNTALFYKLGFRGINIEPNPKLFQHFITERQEDVNLNIGISKKNGIIDYYEMSESSLNTFSKESVYFYEKEGITLKNTLAIETKQLEHIISVYCQGIFPDVLFIDTEGFDELIIDDLTNLHTFPKIICIESITFSLKREGIKQKDLIKKIESLGYFLYADTYINSIFVRNDIWKA